MAEEVESWSGLVGAPLEDSPLDGRHRRIETSHFISSPSFLRSTHNTSTSYAPTPTFERRRVAFSPISPSESALDDSASVDMARALRLFGKPLEALLTLDMADEGSFRLRPEEEGLRFSHSEETVERRGEGGSVSGDEARRTAETDSIILALCGLCVQSLPAAADCARGDFGIGRRGGESAVGYRGRGGVSGLAPTPASMTTTPPAHSECFRLGLGSIPLRL